MYVGEYLADDWSKCSPPGVKFYPFLPPPPFLWTSSHNTHLHAVTWLSALALEVRYFTDCKTWGKNPDKRDTSELWYDVFKVLCYEVTVSVEQCWTQQCNYREFCERAHSMQISNLAEYSGEQVRRWVQSTPSPTDTPKSKSHLNNNSIDFVTKNFWSNRQQEDMPMLLQQPSHVILSSHETDQPLDFTMSKFKTKTSNTVASQLKQLNSLTQQQKMLLHNNGYYNSRNNNNSFTGASSPSSSSEEEGVGPPGGSPESPGPLRGDGKDLISTLFTYARDMCCWDNAIIIPSITLINM